MCVCLCLTPLCVSPCLPLGPWNSSTVKRPRIFVHCTRLRGWVGPKYHKTLYGFISFEGFPNEDFSDTRKLRKRINPSGSWLDAARWRGSQSAVLSWTAQIVIWETTWGTTTRSCSSGSTLLRWITAPFMTRGEHPTIGTEVLCGFSRISWAFSYWLRQLSLALHALKMARNVC